MFPPLDASQHEHLQRVQQMLRDAVAAAGGWLSFADYMQLALYAPGLGYYSAGATKFGAAGDFVTAPEISPLFAPVVARSIADVLGHLASPANAGQSAAASVLELGAGTGRFAAGALAALAAQQQLPQRYDILEVSADLRARQRETVLERSASTTGDAAQRVRWLDRLPEDFQGVVFANEVLDALPTERFIVRGGEPRLLGVGAAAQGLQVCEQQAASDARAQSIAQRLGPLLRELPEGYVGECCLAVGPWIAALAAALQRGVLLLIDYGLPRAQLYHPQRQDGTLRCFFRHRAHDDPLFRPGLCDISAWVDFTAVAEAALDHGLELLGFTTQAGYLLENGIESLLARNMPDPQRATLAHGARQLLLPGEMGESFKVMALGRGYDGPLSGFRLQDLTARL